MIKSMAALLAIVFSLSAAPAAFAADSDGSMKGALSSKKVSIGGLLGGHFSDLGDGLAFGANASYALSEGVRLGGSWRHFSDDLPSHDLVAAELMADMSSLLPFPGFNVGLVAGFSRLADWSFAYGPKIGFDYPIASNISLGADVAWTFTKPVEETVGTLWPMAALKYHF